MTIIMIDGNNINCEDDFHDLMFKELELPSYYGRNLNALWDCMTAWVEFPLTIEWINFSESQKKMGQAAEDTLQFFKDAENELKSNGF